MHKIICKDISLWILDNVCKTFFYSWIHDKVAKRPNENINKDRHLDIFVHFKYKDTLL
jgi:hypothetical protein